MLEMEGWRYIIVQEMHAQHNEGNACETTRQPNTDRRLLYASRITFTSHVHASESASSGATRAHNPLLLKSSSFLVPVA
jgi:hypothetical protein